MRAFSEFAVISSQSSADHWRKRLFDRTGLCISRAAAWYRYIHCTAFADGYLRCGDDLAFAAHEFRPDAIAIASQTFYVRQAYDLDDFCRVRITFGFQDRGACTAHLWPMMEREPDELLDEPKVARDAPRVRRLTVVQLCRYHDHCRVVGAIQGVAKLEQSDDNVSLKIQ